MIELLLQAERALALGLVDQAERLYRQAIAADPRNSIAVVGLARVALEHSDDAEAYRRARQALQIDPENVAANRLVRRLEEVHPQRASPGAPAAMIVPAQTSSPAPAASPTAVPAPETAPEAGARSVARSGARSGAGAHAGARARTGAGARARAARARARARA